MDFIRKNTKLLFILVLPVYFYIVQSSILNKHTHFYANGLVVTHSHSVDLNENEPINNHEHTQTEICLFYGINFDLYTVTPQNTVDFGIIDNIGTFAVYNIYCEYTSEISQTVPRGPPFRIS